MYCYVSYRKNTKLNVEEHPLIKRYIETYDQISEVVKLQKVKEVLGLRH